MRRSRRLRASWFCRSGGSKDLAKVFLEVKDGFSERFVPGTNPPPSFKRQRLMEYRHLATSQGGFIQQMVCHLKNGFRYYVRTQIPNDKDPAKVDEKLIGHYGIGLSPFDRWKKKRSGLATTHYLRFERTIFLLTNSLGADHRLALDHRDTIRHASEIPIVFFGHAISFRAGHVCVEVEKNSLAGLYRHFEAIAHWPKGRLIREIRSLPFERYKPVVRQLRELVRFANRLRRRGGLKPVPVSCAGRGRTVYQPFVKL